MTVNVLVMLHGITVEPECVLDKPPQVFFENLHTTFNFFEM